MKKTMIALATIATVGSVSAQVVITGGLDHTWGKTTSSGAAATTAYAFDTKTGGNTPTTTSPGSVSRGIANTDAYIDIVATETLGNGWTAKAAMEFNADGGWSSGMYSGDKSVSLSGPGLTLTVATTRSGSILDKIMMAPEVNPTDHWGSTNVGNEVMKRSDVDALVISGAVFPGLNAAYKYVETGAVKGDGYSTPAVTSNVIGLYYTISNIGLNYEGQIANKPDNANGSDVRTTRHDITGTLDAGFAKFALGYESGNLFTPNSSSVGTASGAFFASVKGSMGATDLGLNYGKRDNAGFAEVAAQYNFSKTTYVAASYGTYNAQDNSSSDSYGIRIGKNF